MTRRIENKIDIDKTNKISFFNWLKEKKAKLIFKPRQIYSIYFDNNDLSIYTDSVEGISKRKKIRIRTYDSLDLINNNKKLEFKYTSPYGRSKLTQEINNFPSIIKTGFFDNMYGICMPKLIVSYKRFYYKIENERITYDENISYAKFKINLKNLVYSYDPEIIIEVKSNNYLNESEINKNIPFKTVRFSKYCNAIEKLNMHQ
jgi:hypothetical protein